MKLLALSSLKKGFTLQNNMKLLALSSLEKGLMGMKRGFVTAPPNLPRSLKNRYLSLQVVNFTKAYNRPAVGQFESKVENAMTIHSVHFIWDDYPNKLYEIKTNQFILGEFQKQLDEADVDMTLLARMMPNVNPRDYFHTPLEHNLYFWRMEYEKHGKKYGIALGVYFKLAMDMYIEVLLSRTLPCFPVSKWIWTDELKRDLKNFGNQFIIIDVFGQGDYPCCKEVWYVFREKEKEEIVNDSDDKIVFVKGDVEFVGYRPPLRLLDEYGEYQLYFY